MHEFLREPLYYLPAGVLLYQSVLGHAQFATHVQGRKPDSMTKVSQLDGNFTQKSSCEEFGHSESQKSLPNAENFGGCSGQNRVVASGRHWSVMTLADEAELQWSKSCSGEWKTSRRTV